MQTQVGTSVVGIWAGLPVARVAMKPSALASVRFGEGRVKLLSDFDHTYFPLKEREVPERRDYLKSYFAELGQFFKTAAPALRFRVTTARDFSNLQRATQRLENADIPITWPERMIVQDGSDEFLHPKAPLAPDTAPLPWSGVNLARRQAILEKSGWDTEQIREIFRTLLAEEAIPYQEEIRDPVGLENATPAKGWGAWQNRHWVIQDGPFQFTGYFRTQDVNADVLYQKLKAQMPASVLVSRPRSIDKGYKFKITLRPLLDAQPLSKHYDAHRAVKKAKAENDLVIAAGDGSNDVDMLDPASYLPELKQLGDQPDAIKAAIEASPYLQERLKQLPFMGVVLQRENSPEPGLERLVRIYGDNTPWRKLIQMPPGGLLDGVKRALHDYRQQNKHFSAVLQPEIRAALGENSSCTALRASTAHNLPEKPLSDEKRAVKSPPPAFDLRKTLEVLWT